MMREILENEVQYFAGCPFESLVAGILSWQTLEEADTDFEKTEINHYNCACFFELP